jgi:hypothetical protein
MMPRYHPTPPPLSAATYEKILSATIAPDHRLLLLLAWELAESFTPLLRLRTSDLYADFEQREPLEMLWLPQRGKPWRLRPIRCSAALDFALRSFSPVDHYWLFPSRICPHGHLSDRAAARALGRAAKRAGLPVPISPRYLKRSALAYWRSLGESEGELGDRAGLSIAAVRRQLEKTMAAEPDLSRI